MGSVIAVKNGKKRTFNDVTWKLLGKDHDGWQPMADQLVDNLAPIPATKPATGQRTDQPKTVELKPEILSDKKLEFEKAAVGISKGVIKDWMQKNGMDVDNTLAKPLLVDKLGEHMNYNVAELQKILS